MYIISPVLATAELLYTSMLFNTLKIMYTRIYKLCVEIINIYLFIYLFKSMLLGKGNAHFAQLSTILQVAGT